MSKQRVRRLMKKVAVEDSPLAKCRTLAEFNLELSKLSDSALLNEYERALRIRAACLTDEELLRRHAELTRGEITTTEDT